MFNIIKFKDIKPVISAVCALTIIFAAVTGCALASKNTQKADANTVSPLANTDDGSNTGGSSLMFNGNNLMFLEAPELSVFIKKYEPKELLWTTEDEEFTEATVIFKLDGGELEFKTTNCPSINKYADKSDKIIVPNGNEKLAYPEKLDSYQFALTGITWYEDDLEKIVNYRNVKVGCSKSDVLSRFYGTGDSGILYDGRKNPNYVNDESYNGFVGGRVISCEGYDEAIEYVCSYKDLYDKIRTQKLTYYLKDDKVAKIECKAIINEELGIVPSIDR